MGRSRAIASRAGLALAFAMLASLCALLWLLVSPPGGRALAATAGQAEQAGGAGHVEGEAIVVFDDGAALGALGDEEASDGGAAGHERAVQAIEDEPCVEEVIDEGSESALVELAPGVGIDEAIAELSEIPGVAYVQPNYLYELLDDPAYTVNDPYAKRKDTASSPNQWWLWRIRAPQAWSLKRCAGTVTVAVIDTGINFDHVDLKDNIDTAHAYDAYEGKKLTESAAPDAWHGTHVAGVIAARAGNGTQFAGVSYNAKILPINAFYESISGRYYANTYTVTEAYGYLAGLIDAGEVRDLHVINMSLGGYRDESYYRSGSKEPGYDRKLQQAIAAMNNRGVVTVCAGGNSSEIDPSTGETYFMYPSDYDECIAVVATDVDDDSMGTAHNRYKDIAAPGTEVWSTGAESKTDWRVSSGTSMAAPMVSGVLALMYAKNPGLTVAQAKKALYTTAVDLGVKGRDDYFGWGLVDAHAALAATPAASGTSVKPPTLKAAAISKGDSVEVSWGAAAGAASYEVYRRAGSSLVWEKVGTTGKAKTTFVDASVTSAKTYRYRVVAKPGSTAGWTGTAASNTARVFHVGTVVELGGANRYATCAQTVNLFAALAAAGSAKPQTVILASGESFADALTAAGLAGIYGAPVLLTAGQSLPSQSRARLVSLAPERVLVVGGTPTISAAVVGEVRSALGSGCSISRIAGANRIATAEAIYAKGRGIGSGWGRTALIARADDFADALAAAPFAYAAKAPVFLAPRTAGGRPGLLGKATLAALSSGGFDTVVILGGTDSVAAGVASQIRSSAKGVKAVKRIAGANRYATSQLFATWATGSAKVLARSQVGIATGRSFPDALSAAPLLGSQQAPLILVDSGTAGLSSVTGSGYIKGNASAIQRVYVFGSTDAVSASVRARVERTAGVSAQTAPQTALM